MEGIKQWIEAEGSGHWFFVAFPVALICLFIWFKGRRVRFLIPSLIISIVIINPVFYKYWDKMGLYAYWRILWIVPVVPVVAGLVPSITERIQRGWIKAIVAAAGVGLVMVGGTFLYNGAGGSFVEAANAAKEPDYVVQIADRLLEMDEHPRVIAQDPIGVYLRQYTGEIDQLFGRDVHGYMTWGGSVDANKVNEKISNTDSDLDTVSQFMLDDGYDYLVLKSARDTDLFESVDTIGEYTIYSPVGIPRMRKNRNELGQITELTYFNSEGQPDDGLRGFSTIHREYDDHNNVIKEWYTNTAGNVITRLAGYEIIAQTWQGTRIETRSYLDVEGDSITRTDGYSKAVWQNDENGARYVSFYTVDGNEMDSRGLNLVNDKIAAEGWSDWMTPDAGIENYCFTLGTINLDKRTIGDTYACQIEIEFRDVETIDGSPFHFWTQGSVDGRWDIGNVWDGFLVWLESAPDDGVYAYTSLNTIDENMKEASAFELGFRCDNWSSGSFRVRKTKVEKGGTPTSWTPGL